MVIHVKWGIYAGVLALLLAFTISIFIGQAGFAVSILRGLGFAALFFVLGVGAWTLINTFIPELLFPEANDAAANIFGSESSGLQSSDSGSYGSYVNITLGDRSDAALPDSNGPDSDEVGNIADLVSGAVDPAEEAKRKRGLDEISENSYTNSGEDTIPPLNGVAEPLPAEGEGGGFSMNFDNFALGGGLVGLEPFGDSFSLPDDSGGTSKEEVFSLPERKVTGNKPMTLEGDFNPKDIAAGIRTVLETDKKG
jgi:hypothetical protein